uniref:VRR-NUC domain-containing protein n=1 Tax=viral metagenome TaxID=1070528 RepID=A0A6H1ZCB6_9ZZZZ
MSETDIQRTILEGLWYNRVIAWRYQNIPVPIRQGGRITGLRRVDQNNIGLPDIMAIYKGMFYGIEVKTRIGRQSKDQKEWERKINEAGGKYILARSWEDVKEGMKLC